MYTRDDPHMPTFVHVYMYMYMYMYMCMYMYMYMYMHMRRYAHAPVESVEYTTKIKDYETLIEPKCCIYNQKQ